MPISRTVASLALILLAIAVNGLGRSVQARPQSAAAPLALAAFPGAVGYGAGTRGGRGGRLLRVTRLDDRGPGSLRWALEDVRGPRIIIFDVSGMIALERQILIENGYVTLAGQSAPWPGVTLSGARIRIKATEVIIRGMRFRPGDGRRGQDPGDRDGVSVGTTDFEINNVILDHNSFTWAIDENVAVNGRVRNITLSSNIIAQGLTHSIHPKGEHSKGLLISNWDGEDDWASRISVVSNLFAANTQRNPEIRAGQAVEVINNLIYDHGLGRAAIAVGGGSGGRLTTDVRIVGNVIAAGPGTSRATAPITLSTMAPNSAIFIHDLLWRSQHMDPFIALSAVASLANADAQNVIRSAPGRGPTPERPASEVFERVLITAGASPGRRDPIDGRIIAGVRRDTGLQVASVAQAGTAEAVAPDELPADGDQDGIPDAFEQRLGSDPRVSDGNLDRDGDGYPDIETYLNSLIRNR